MFGKICHIKIDLDIDPVTLKFKFGLHMVKIYLYTENEIPCYSSSKVIAQTDRQIDGQTDTQTDKQTHLTDIITCLHMVIKQLN